MEEEVWKPYKYRENYEISSHGQIRNTITNKIIKSHIQGDGYVRMQISRDKGHYVHRLVAIHFLDNPDNLPSVDHIDRKRDNNKVTNLRWASFKTQMTNIGSHGCLKRKIAKVDILTNKIIETYDSISDAAKALPNSDRRLINAVCRGKRKTHAGFKWKYLDIHVNKQEDEEKWIWMKEYTNEMYISDHGRIKFKDGRISTGSLSNMYKRIHLTLIENNKEIHMLVHRLVAIYFLENPNKYPIVNHKDGVKSNNRVDNLEWCTHSHNTLHAHKTGLIKKKSILECPGASMIV